jgi:hypothetical protein
MEKYPDTLDKKMKLLSYFLRYMSELLVKACATVHVQECDCLKRVLYLNSGFVLYALRINSGRTLTHIIITCFIPPTHVGRSSSSGMWWCEARWVLPEVLRHCIAPEMSRPT